MRKQRSKQEIKTEKLSEMTSRNPSQTILILVYRERQKMKSISMLYRKKHIKVVATSYTLTGNYQTQK